MTSNDPEMKNRGFSEVFATSCCDAHLKSKFRSCLSWALAQISCKALWSCSRLHIVW